MPSQRWLDRDKAGAKWIRWEKCDDGVTVSIYQNGILMVQGNHECIGVGDEEVPKDIKDDEMCDIECGK